MKSIQAIIRVGLLCAMTFVFFNCKKEKVDPEPIFNYTSFTDVRDGKVYKSIKIGTQEWMAENLTYKTADGSWYSYDSDIEGAKFGRLYTWEAAIEAVPAGWHLPSDEEWKQLEMALGMSQKDADDINSRGTDQGTKLKARKGWGDELNGLDEVGFNALPGGTRANSGSYFANSWVGYWWTGTAADNSRVWMRFLYYNSPKVYRNLSYKEDGYSVRCVKN